MKLTPTSSLTALVLLAAPLTAQGMLPYLPKQTIMAASAPDLSMTMAEFKQMPLAKMWAEDEVQDFFADIMEMAEEQMGDQMTMVREMHAAGQLPVDPDQLMKLRLQGVTLAVTRMSMSQGDFGPMPDIGVFAHLDFGESAPMWNTLIQMGLAMADQEVGDYVDRKETKIGDITMITYSPPEDAGGMRNAMPYTSLNIAMVPNGIILSTSTDDLKATITNMVGKTPALAATPGFAAATKNIDSAGAEVQLFMAPDRIMDFAMNTLQVAMDEEPDLQMIDMDGVKRAMQAMGMTNIGTLAASSSYTDGKSVTKSYHATPGNSTASTTTIDTKFLKWVPKDAVAFSAGTLDIGSIYDTIQKALTAYNPEMAKQALGQLAQMEGQLGFTIRGDMVGSIGDHMITWSMPMGTISSAPEIAVLLKINNEEKLVNSLRNLAALTQGMIELEEGTKRGVKSYAITVNPDMMDMMDMPMEFNIFEMFQPTFAFKDGYMVIGFSASDVKRVFKRMDREDNPKGDIRSNKEFMACADSIPQGITMLSFTDWKADFESLYQLATGVLAFVPMPEDVPIDMSLLPDSETLTRHLFASVSYTKSDANGGQTINVSPFGPELPLIGGALLSFAGAMLAFTLDGGF